MGHVGGIIRKFISAAFIDIILIDDFAPSNKLLRQK